jgi:hypothetical protein
MAVTDTIKRLRCVQCTHEWWPVRPKNPLKCPCCQSFKWLSDPKADERRAKLAEIAKKNGVFT